MYESVQSNPMRAYVGTEATHIPRRLPWNFATSSDRFCTFFLTYLLWPLHFLLSRGGSICAEAD
jgi:hypothetical protein